MRSKAIAARRQPDPRDKEEARSLGTALLMLRRSRGMTPRAVWETSGVSRANLSRYELGRSVPRLSTLRRIVEAIGVSMGDLYRAQYQAQVREELTGKDEAARPDRAAAVRLAQECGKAVAHCCLAFMELQAGGWRLPPTE
jgi:transcriptional regulator with XRE-family HTH domain